MLRVTYKIYTQRDGHNIALDAANIMQNSPAGSGLRMIKGSTGIDSTLDLEVNERLWSREDREALYELIRKNTGVNLVKE